MSSAVRRIWRVASDAVVGRLASPWARASRRGVIALLAAFGLYLFAANILLGTHLLRHIIAVHPDKLRVEYRSAYSLWPGRVRIAGLEIRGSDDNVQWNLRIQAVAVRISLLDLAQKRFHASHVRANGVAFRLRQKLEPADVTPETTDRLPPIDGFADPPVMAPAPSPRGTGEPWAVELEDVDASAVGLVWINGYRYEGESRVWGAMVLQPQRVLEVGPAVVAIESGGVWTGTEPVGLEVSGMLMATIERHDPREAPRAQILQHLSAATDFSGTVANLRFVRHFLRDPSIEIGGGQGPVKSSVRIDHGMIAPGTAIDVVGASMTIGGSHLHATSNSHGSLVVGSPALPVARFDVQLAGLQMHDDRFADEPISTPGASATATSHELDLQRPFTDLHVHVDVPHSTVANMRVIDAQIPPRDTFSFDGGNATVGAAFDLSVASRTASGQMSMTSPKLDGHLFRSRLDARVAVELRLVSADFKARTFDLAGTTVDLRDVSTTGASSNDRWWGRFEAGPFLVHAEPPRVEVHLNGRARDGRPLLAVFETNVALPTVARAALVLVPTGVLGGPEGFTASARLAVAREVIDLTGLDVRGGDVRVRGDFHRHGARRSGAMLIAVPPLSLGIAFHPVGTTLDLMASEAWLHGHRAGEAGDSPPEGRLHQP